MEVNQNFVNEIYQLRSDISKFDLEEQFDKRLEQLESMIIILSTDYGLRDVLVGYVRTLVDLKRSLSL